MEKFDLTVIGGGPAGYVTAIKAAQLGMSVAVAEASHTGGVCLNKGCIATKSLLHSAETFASSRIFMPDSSRLCTAEAFSAMHSTKDETISLLRGGIEKLLEANGVALVRGVAHIVSPDTVAVGNEALINTRKILVATGSSPALPPIRGIENAVTSDDVLTDPQLCGNALANGVIIIGGGVIGMEFALFFVSLGCAVTVIEAAERVLPSADRDVSLNLSMIMKKRGVRIMTGTRTESIVKDNALFAVTTDRGDAVTAGLVVAAVGRKGNAEAVVNNLLPTEKGYLRTDSHFRTAVPDIYAAGDVTGGIQLAHAASAQGINAVCAMVGIEAEKTLSAVPACVFTSPEIAFVGMTEEAAKTAGINAKTAKYLMSGNGRTLTVGGERGFVKLVADETGVILGASLMCERASDMIFGLTAAINCRIAAKQLAASVFPHPTFSEGICEAAELLLGGGIHTMPKRNKKAEG